MEVEKEETKENGGGREREERERRDALRQPFGRAWKETSRARTP